MNDCFACDGKCCVGDIEVTRTDTVYENAFLTVEATGEGYDRVMRTTKDNRCIAFVDHRCLIYSKRPDVCRRFEIGSACCEEFKKGKKTEHRCEKCVLQNGT